MGMQSLLHYGFGLQDQEYIKTEYKEGEIIIHIRTKTDKLCCSACGSGEVIKKGKVYRRFKTVGIGMKAVFLMGEISRLQCKGCGLTRQEKVRYADEKKHIPGH